MTDRELLQAIGQVVEAKMEPMRQDIHDLKEDVRELKKNYIRLEAKVDALEKRMDSLEAKVDDFGERADSLEKQMTGVRVYMDTELKRTLNLLLEGQQALWDRFVPQEKFDPLEDRTQVLELTVKRHSQEIRELQFA